MISAHRIEYRGYSSVDFDLITCLSFESDDGEVNSFLTREAVASESYRGEFKRIHNFKYTETMNPKFTFIKDGFGDFTTEDIRNVLRWLTSGTNASFLTVFKDDSNIDHFEILGGFTEVLLYKLGNDRCVGIVATFESAHPYAFSPLYTYSQSMVNTAHRKFTIPIDSDEEESAIYPRVTIKQHDSVLVYVDRPMIVNGAWVDSDYIDGTVYYYDATGDYYYNKHNADGSIVTTITKTNPVTTSTKTSVIIKSVNTDEYGKVHTSYLRIKNNSAGETIVLDGANKVVSSSATKRIFGNDFDWNWLPFYNGMNEITVIGSCDVEFKWRTVRKIGEI